MKVELKKGEDNSLNSSRKALGNVTNQLGKRRFSSIPVGSCSKSGDGYSENTGKKVGKNSGGVKRVRVSPGPSNEINFLKGNAIQSTSKINNDNKDPDLMEDGETQTSVKVDACVAGISKVAVECKNSVLLNLIKDDSVSKSVVQVGDGLRENCVSGVLKTLGEDGDPNMLEVSSGDDAPQNIIQLGDEPGTDIIIHNSASDRNCVNLGDNYNVGEGVAGSENNQSYQDEGDFHGGGEDCVMSQTGSIDFSRLLESQESRCFGLERCTTLKGDGCSDSSAAIDMIKACTCSFCSKAAYIWTDLHYQDYKGRLATIKKSEKEASVLVERSCRSLGTEKHGVRNTLESELTGQWRSLFVHMENIFERECSQLEDSLLPLKDLREKCKAGLELLNRPHQ